jgi:hypothetical protein
MSDTETTLTPSDTASRTFLPWHQGGPEARGPASRRIFLQTTPERRSPWIYFSETVFAATWERNLAKGEGRGGIYEVEPTGPFMDDPM